MFILTALLHFLITTPSMLFFGSQIVSRMTYEHETLTLTNKNVVVFVHGRNANPSQFAGVIKILADKSETFVVNGIEYYLRAANLGKTAYSSLETDAKSLYDDMRALRDCNITLVGVSKGGLVAMNYATSYQDPRIKKVITISSPLQGTHITKLWSWTSHVCIPKWISSVVPQGWLTIENDMGYHNPKVLEIMSKAKNLTIPLFHVVPTYDHVIIPTSSAFYTFTPTKNILFYKGYDNHAMIPYNKEVLGFVVKVLGK